MRKPLGHLFWLWLSLLVIAVDLWSKSFAVRHLQLYESYSILPGCFAFTLAHNYGAAFSFLYGAGGWQRWFLSAIAIVVSGLLVAWLLRLPREAKFLPVAIALLLGGALGNLYDRIVQGYVVDFIHVYYGNWHFPAFNIADSAITVGTLMLLVDMMFLEPHREVKNG